jgi:hypothetical protein
LQKRGEHRAEFLVIIHYEHPGYIYIHGHLRVQRGR